MSVENKNNSAEAMEYIGLYEDPEYGILEKFTETNNFDKVTMEYIGLYDDPKYGVLPRFRQLRNDNDQETSMESLLQVLQESMEYMDYSDMLKYIYRRESSKWLIASDSFNYGMMMGKREERQRCRKRACREKREQQRRAAEASEMDVKLVCEHIGEIQHIVKDCQTQEDAFINVFSYGVNVGKGEERQVPPMFAEVSFNELSSMAIQFGQTHSPEEVRASQKEIQSIFNAFWKLAATVSEQQKITTPGCNPEVVISQV